MRICIVSDTLNGYNNKGGAEVQLERTIDVLRSNNIDIVFYDNNPITILESDAVHFFKSLPQYWYIASFCLKNNIPYFVSTIFYITDSYNYFQFNISKLCNKLGLFTVSSILRLWSNASFIFPNTTSEENQILRYTNANSLIVRNCIDDDFIKANIINSKIPKEVLDLNGNFVLNIGRIEKRKNQIRLAKACERIKLPLVLIGPNSNDKYFRKLMKMKGVIYLGAIWDVEIKKSIISQCKIFALPSLLETPGIVALEAKYLNKKILITKNGIGKGYFDDYPLIKKVNPLKVNDIYYSLNFLLKKTDVANIQNSVPTYPIEIKKIIESYNL